MQNTDNPTATDLRVELSPVSERFAAFELGPDLVIYDREDPDRWIAADCGVPRDELR